METRAMRQELAQLGAGAHALAIQILGNVDDAADAVHDSFASVLSRPEAYDRQKGPLKPWFMRVVRNRCVDMIRRRKGDAMPVEELVDPAPDPEQLAVAEQRSARIGTALTALSRDKREVIVLRDYLDLSYAEIADVLDVAPGTVMSRIHRARLTLMEALGSYDD
jgi:RNA polymerase sigma-70 factor (ECF subfamily)